MEGEEAGKEATCIGVETGTTDQGEDVQVYYLDVPNSEEAQVLDISNILAQEGIQIVEADSQSQTVILEADGHSSNDPSATQSAQALLNLSKAHIQSQTSPSIKVVDILDVGNQIPTDGDLANHQISEPMTATYVVDENGTMVPLSEYRETHGSSFLEMADSSSHAVFTCWCGKEFFTQDDLDKHKQAHSKRRVRGSAQHKCELCSEIFNTASKLANHHRVVHPDGMPWECPICFRRFSKKLGLKVHLRAHSGLKQHKCSYCERSFSYKNALLRHIRLHTKDKPYKCTICGELFAHMWAMRRHRANHKPKHLFQCDICCKTFKQKQTLFIHARVHTGLKPYTCEICRKSFTLKSSLNQHLRIHTGERPKICSICQKAFRQASTLKSHMKLHSHLKPHKCRYCKKRFSMHEEMLQHETVHLSNKSWMCDECGMRFRNQSLLARHVRKHTNERPFQCKICGKSFSQSGSLQSHMRTHTKEKPYQCRLCPKMYTTSGTLLLHIRRSHNLEAKSVKDVFPSTQYVEDQKIFTIPTPVPINRSSNMTSMLDGDGVKDKSMAEVLHKDDLVFEEVVDGSQDEIVGSNEGNVIIQRINPFQESADGNETEERAESDPNEAREEEADNNNAGTKAKKIKKRGKKMSVKDLRGNRKGSVTVMNVDSMGRYKVVDMEKENSLYAQARQEAALGLAELSLVGGVVVAEKKSGGTAYRTLARESENDASEEQSVTKIILSKEGGIMNSQDPHQCPECKRIFGRKSIMVEHRRIHTDEKPYKCDFCPGGFRQSAQLTCHIRNKHTKEKKYQCTFCQKKFLSHSITVRHINFHHKLKVRVCEGMCQGWKVDDAIYKEKSDLEETYYVVDETNEAKGEIRGTVKYGRKSNITILNSMSGIGSPTVKVKFGTEKKKTSLKSPDRKDGASTDVEVTATAVNLKQEVEEMQTVQLYEQQRQVEEEEGKDAAVIGTWYVCETCALQFNTMDSLRWHLKQVHSTTLAESDVSYVFEDEPLGNVTKEAESQIVSGQLSTADSQVEKSVVAAAEEVEKPIRAVVTEQIVVKDDRSNVKNHADIQVQHIKPTLVCCMCSVYCETRVELEQHMMSHENDEVETAGLHRCDTCSMVMKNTQQVTKHILKVHGVENIFGCSICDKEFFQESSVLRHMKFFHKWEMKIRGEGNIPVLLKPASDHLKVPGGSDKDKVKGKVRLETITAKKPPKSDVKVSSRYENDMTFISLEVGDLDHLQLYREDGQEVRFEVVSSTDKATVIRIKEPGKELGLNGPMDMEDDSTPSYRPNVSTEAINVQEDISHKRFEDPKVVVTPFTSKDDDESATNEQLQVVVLDENGGNSGEIVFQEDSEDAVEERNNKEDSLDKEAKSMEPSSSGANVRSDEKDEGSKKDEDVEITSKPSHDKHVTPEKDRNDKDVPKSWITTPSKAISVIDAKKSVSKDLNSKTLVRVVSKKSGKNVHVEEKNSMEQNMNSSKTKVRTISILNETLPPLISSPGKTSPNKRAVVCLERLKPDFVTTELSPSAGEVCIKEEIVDTAEENPSYQIPILAEEVQKSSQVVNKKRGRPSKSSSSVAASPVLQMIIKTEVSTGTEPSNESTVASFKTPQRDTQPMIRSSSGRCIKRKRFADE